MKKQLCALLAGAFLLTAGPCAAAFSDVSEGDWHHGAVEYVSAEGLMSGVTGDLFAPSAPVTRGTVVTVLYRMAGAPQTAESAPFSDVPAGQWYSAGAAWAKEAGVAAGYADGAFGPNDNVTREQLAVFLHRYAAYTNAEVAEGVVGVFIDHEAISSWAAEGVSHAVGLGLLTGKDGNRLDPGGVAARAELAVILQRLLTPAAG